MKVPQNPLLLLCLAALLSSPAFGKDPLPTQHADPNLIEKVHRVLHVEGPRKAQIDDILEAVQRAVDREEADQQKGRESKDKTVQSLVKAMMLELRSILSDREYARVSEALYGVLKPGAHSKLAIQYSDIFPQSAETREIFGRAVGSFGLAYGGDEIVNSRWILGATLGGYEMWSNDNDVVVLSPEARFEYRLQISDRFYTFAEAAGGPAYMDYSFDTPSHHHLGAKRAGLVGNAGLGFQVGPLRVEGDYVASTEPAGINFDAVEVTITATFVRW